MANNNLLYSIVVVLLVIGNITAILFFLICILIYKRFKSKKQFKNGAPIFISQRDNKYKDSSFATCAYMIIKTYSKNFRK